MEIGMRSPACRRGRESGVVLLMAILLTIMVFGICGSAMMVSLTEAKEAIETTDNQTAFYLAESGLAAAKWEIAGSQDPDGNGIGTKDVVGPHGSYTVAVTDLGGDIYQLNSTGIAGGSAINLQEVVARVYTSRFPPGAMSVVGNVVDFDIEIEQDADLIIDGGDSPALSFSDPNVYNRVGNEFAGAVNAGWLPSTNITGSPLNTFGTPAVDLPILHQSTYDDSLKDFTALYNEVVSRVNALRPTATVVGPTFDPTYGTAESPVTIYAPNLNTIVGQTITGYGTLIIGDHLRLDPGTTVNWTGDIFVIGDATKDAELEVHGGTLNVTGNVVVLGEGAVDTEFEINNGGQATVDGSLFFGTDWTDPAGPESELEINSDGNLTVNGLLTMVGSQIQIEFSEPTSNPLNQITINGMMQVAVPDSPGVETKIELELEGSVEIRRDVAAIESGAAAIQALGVSYTVPQTSQLINTEDMRTLSWRRMSS